MKGWKTVIFGVALALLALLSNEEMAAFFAEHIEWVGGLTGTAIVVLRWITTSPIFKSE